MHERRLTRARDDRAAAPGVRPAADVGALTRVVEVGAVGGHLGRGVRGSEADIGLAVCVAQVGAVAGGGVVLGAAGQPVGVRGAVEAVNRVVAGHAVEDVVAGVAGDLIVAGGAVDDVRAAVAGQRVVAAAAAQPLDIGLDVVELAGDAPSLAPSAIDSDSGALRG